MKEKVRVTRAGARKRKRMLRWLTAVLLVVSLVGVIAFAAFMDSKKDDALPKSDDMATDVTDSAEEEPEASEEEPSEDLVYISTPYTKVYADDRVTVLYEADLGDRFERLETASGYVKLQLNEQASGWVAEERVTNEASTSSDEEIKAAWKQVVPSATDDAAEWLGQDIASLRSTLGTPATIQRDQVNEYHFYNGYFLVVRDEKVKAVDWDRQTIATPDLEASSTQPAGSWYEGETLQLKLFPYDGIMRVRLEIK